MNAELLAKLAASGIDLEKVSYGGIPDLTAMDIAGALKHLDDMEYELLRVKYCQDKPHKLFAYVFTHLMDQGWSIEQGAVERITLHSIAEAVGSNRCPACNGTAQAMIDGKVLNCPNCGGSGMEYKMPSENKYEAEYASKYLRRIEYAALSKVESLVDDSE